MSLMYLFKYELPHTSGNHNLTFLEDDTIDHWQFFPAIPKLMDFCVTCILRWRPSFLNRFDKRFHALLCLTSDLIHSVTRDWHVWCHHVDINLYIFFRWGLRFVGICRPGQCIGSVHKFPWCVRYLQWVLLESDHESLYSQWTIIQWLVE